MVFFRNGKSPFFVSHVIKHTWNSLLQNYDLNTLALIITTVQNILRTEKIRRMVDGCYILRSCHSVVPQHHVNYYKTPLEE